MCCIILSDRGTFNKSKILNLSITKSVQFLPTDSLVFYDWGQNCDFFLGKQINCGTKNLVETIFISKFFNGGPTTIGYISKYVHGRLNSTQETYLYFKSSQEYFYLFNFQVF